jgi:hypothetical protein
MADRRTRVTLSIPWDDEETDHPAQWDYTGLLDSLHTVHVVDFRDLSELGVDDYEIEEVTVAKPVGAIVSARLPKEIAEQVFAEAEAKNVPASSVLAAIIVAHFVEREEP